MLVFFFKQKTAYEMRISDWSSDVCSSDLASERFGTPDPFKGVKRLKGRRPDVKPFSLDEVEKIRTTIRPDFRNYVTCRFFTGMRTGEINGLKWKYVDFEHEVIRVREVFSAGERSEEHTSELQSLMRISYAVFCLKKKNKHEQL